MTGKTQDTEFRHPEVVVFLQGLTDEAAAKYAVLSREQDGVVAQQRREGGEGRCREVEGSGGGLRR